MGSFFQDTAFGAIARELTGGRLFQYQDVNDETLRTRYIQESREKQSRSSPSDDELEKGKEHDLVLVDFLDGDVENPRNWSLAKRCFVTFNICLLTFSIYVGSAICTSGLRDVQRTFGASSTMAILGLTLYVLGYGIGPMLWSPMSEITFVGRNKVYIGTLFCFIWLNFGVVYAPNMTTLLAFRFFTGFFVILATGGASLADIWRPAKRAYPFAVFGMANVAGPTVGPVVGNWAAQFESWTWTIWIIIWMSGFAFVWLFFLLPETSANFIITQRTIRLRKAQSDGATQLKCQPEIDGERMQVRDMVQMTLVRPFTLGIYEAIVLALNLYIALIYAVLYCWLESIPIVFEQIHGFSLGISGLCYIGLIVGGLLPRFNDDGELKPEIRLETALVGCFCLPICFFMFGWTGRTADIHWIVPVIATSFFNIGAFLSFAAVLNYLDDSYPAEFASISAGNDLFRSCFGACFPLFANQMFSTLGIDWGNSLLGFLAICFIPIIFMLWWKGGALRARSKNARQDM